MEKSPILVNRDGSIDTDQLQGLPAEVAQQLIAAKPKLRIRTGRRELRATPIRTFHVAQMVGHKARNIVKQKKPPEMSGRQWKRSKRLAAKIARANIPIEGTQP